MLFVIRRNWTEWVEAFSTLAEAQTRFDALKAEQPDWNLQILSEGEHTGTVYPSDMSLHEDKPEQGKVYSLFGGKGEPCIAKGNSWAESEVKDQGLTRKNGARPEPPNRGGKVIGFILRKYWIWAGRAKVIVL